MATLLTTNPEHHLRNTTTAEQSDNYAHVVLQLDATTRIINCKDGIQWIWQTRKGNRWRGMKYIRCKESLLRRINLDSLDQDSRAILAALPSVHPWG